MKILLYDTTLSFITPGGKTTHANKLYQELKKLNVNIEFAQWWNKDQEDYDLIHSLTPYVEGMPDYSHKKGKKIILTHIMDIQTNMPNWKKRKEIFQNKIQELFPFTMMKIDGIRNMSKFDHIVFMHKYDRETALMYYPKIDPIKTSIIPHAYDPNDMGIGSEVKLNINLPDKYLISCANIDWRKQSHLLAKYAKKAKTPVVFIGNSNKSNPYYKQFIGEVENKYVFYLGYVDKDVKDYLESHASGYALLSLGESGCIAVFEAAAYNLPLFLSNMPWAWGYENPKNISFCDFNNEKIAVKQLSDFYDKASQLSEPSFQTKTWNQIAQQYKTLYESVLVK
jgi:hypothetical protein